MSLSFASAAPRDTRQSSRGAVLRAHAIGIAVFLALALGSTGCRLIYEPADDAVTRLLEALEARDDHTIKDLVEDEALRDALRQLTVAFNSPPFRRNPGFWRITAVEDDEETDLTYVYVEIDVPREGGRPRTSEIIFEMKRNILRWTILDVIDLDRLLKKIANN